MHRIGSSMMIMCSCVAAPAVAQPFFAEFGVLPGGLLSFAKSVSADGRVVSGDQWGPYLGLVWTREDGLRSITPLDRNGDCSGMSGLGDIVTGGFFGDGTRIAFRWTEETGPVVLGDLDGGIERSQPASVSARGDVIVGYGTQEQGQEAFRWTAESGMVGLGVLDPDSFRSSAVDISADGRVIVGMSYVGPSPDAFRWTEETGMVGLGSAGSRAHAVSADGAVVVGEYYDGELRRGFRWTEETGIVGLAKIQDQRVQIAYGTSWDGNVIVGEVSSDSLGFGAFYWTPEDGTRFVADVLAEHGVDVPEGWRLDRAFAVSADGRTIVGYGAPPNPNEGTRGWVASLGPTCRADHDEDGAVTTQDLWSYLALWQTSNIFADWDYNGDINTRDLIGFLNAWAEGCN